MLRHCVFLDSIDTQEGAQAIAISLEALSKKMPGCLHFSFGRCGAESTAPYYFFMDFVDAVARDRYLEHPEHVKVAQEVIIPQLTKGVQSVTVLDYYTTSAHSPLSNRPSTYGYILAKTGEEISVLEELSEHCSRIQNLKPLQNCSTEALGKAYAYALKIQPKEGSSAIRLKKSPTFWVHASLQPEAALSSTPLPPLSSKL